MKSMLPGNLLLTALVFLIACGSAGDDDDDGTPDAGPAMSHHGAADQSDELAPCTISNDFDGDGVPESLETLEYDDERRPLSNTTDFDADGTNESKTTYVYDAASFITKTLLDNGFDGTIDAVSETTYTASHKLLRQIEIQGDEVTHTHDYVYDENEFLIEVIENWPKDGVGGFHVRYGNDANGCIIDILEDAGNDGSVETHSTLTVDADCNTLETRTDESADGSIDTIDVMTYDAKGRELTRRTTRSGMVTFESTREYEGDLLVLDVVVPNGYRIVTAYEYDADGNLLLVREDSGGSGVQVKTTRYERDEHGNLVRRTQDDDGDGKLDDISTMTYECWGK